MRIVLVFAAMVAWLGIASAAEAPVWAGPGWYQVEFSPGGYRLVAGPFGTIEACLSSKPADQEEEEYSCKAYSEKPSGQQWWGADFPGQ